MPAPPFQLRIRNAILDDRTVPLPHAGALVGRGDNATIRLEDSTISRFHARLEPAQDHVLVTDLDSSNGTFVDDIRISAPTAARGGQQLRFGAVRCELQQVTITIASAAVDAAAPTTPPSRSASKALALMLSLVAVAVTGFFLFREFSAAEAPDSTAALQHDAASVPDAATPLHADNMPVTVPGPASGTLPPSRNAEDAAAPDATEPETADPAAAPAALSAPVRRVQLRDGTVHEGELLDGGDCETLLLQPSAGGPPLRVSTETIASINAVAFKPDYNAIHNARASRARNPVALRALMQWCAEHELLTEQRAAAGRLTKLQPAADDAWAVLGRCRVRGEFRELAEVQAAGLLDGQGRLTGPAPDCRAVTALYLDLLRRPPLPDELSEALHSSAADSITALLANAECARARLAEMAAPLRTGEPPEGMVSALASGSMSLPEAMRQLAEAALISETDRTMLAAALLRMYLPAPQCDDADLRTAAEHMLRGERVALFGERGASAEDLLNILARQPGFFRRLVEGEARRCLGAALDADGTRRAIFRVAQDPRALAALQLEWLSPEQRSKAAARNMAPDQLVAAAIVHGLARLPRPGEVERRTQELRAIGGADAVATLPLLLTLTAPADEAAWSDCIKRCLQRSPSTAELELFRSTPAAQRNELVAAVLFSAESRRYGP